MVNRRTIDCLVEILGWATVSLFICFFTVFGTGCMNGCLDALTGPRLDFWTDIFFFLFVSQLEAASAVVQRNLAISAAAEKHPGHVTAAAAEPQKEVTTAMIDTSFGTNNQHFDLCRWSTSSSTRR